MAQHDYIISNQGFPATRADINNVLNSIATLNSGTSAPSTQYAGQMWIDTTTATNWILYIYDGADNIQIATINTSTNTVNFTDSALDVLTDTTPQLGGNLDVNGNSIVSTSNANITLAPDGTGDVVLSADTVKIGDSNANATITTDGTGDLILNTNSGSSSGSITIKDGANGDIEILPNGTGVVKLDGLSYPTADGTSNQALVTNGSGVLSFATVGGSFADGTAGSPSITFTDDTNTGIFRPTADTIAFTEGGTEAMRIDSSGQVGIGTSSPASQLAVQTTAGSNTGFLRFNDVTYGGQIRFGKNEGISNDAVLGTWGANNTLIFTDSTERMRIGSSGTVFINQTSATALGGINPRLQLTTAQDGISVASLGAGYVGFTTKAAGANNYSAALFMNSTPSTIGSISCTTTATAFNTSSDYRLKENVSYDFDATTRLKQLKPARFNFILEPNKTVDGFLAHEVQSIIPEAITGEKDAVQVWREGEELPEGTSVGDNKLDENDNTIPVYQGIDQAKLTPILTKALQEAITKIESLEATTTSQQNKIDALEARLTALESKIS